MEGRVAVCIVSIAGRYGYRGTEDMATSFIVWEENGFLTLRVELAVFAFLLEAQAAPIIPNYLDFTPYLSCTHLCSILRMV